MMTPEQRKQLADWLEQDIGDLLRGKGILMDGFMCRQVESIAKQISADAIMKKKELAETR